MKYTTRDPQPTTRDPQPEPTPAAMPNQHPPIIRVPPVLCTACGGNTWLSGGTTVPNVTSKEMLRWRSCAKCRKSHYLARPMTAQEIDRYCAPAS